MKHRTNEQAQDLPVGTVIWNPDHDIFSRKRDDDHWDVYFRERHEALHDDDINGDDQGDFILDVQ